MSRQAEIVEALRDHGFQSVNELAARFGVTASTLRRDLVHLESMDLVRRTHGGAMPVTQSETPQNFKAELHRPEFGARRSFVFQNLQRKQGAAAVRRG